MSQDRQQHVDPDLLSLKNNIWPCLSRGALLLRQHFSGFHDLVCCEPHALRKIMPNQDLVFRP